MSTIIKRLTLLFVLSVMIPAFSEAQTSVTVKFTDGTSQDYVIPTSGGIYFSGDTLMHLQTASGQVSHRVDDVRSIAFAHTNSISDAVMETQSLVLYPNPSMDYIFIDGGIDGLQTVVIYSAKGTAVLQGQYSKGDKIDVSALKRGFYIVKIGANALKMYKL